LLQGYHLVASVRLPAVPPEGEMDVKTI
jgi:hypothetical protein